MQVRPFCRLYAGKGAAKRPWYKLEPSSRTASVRCMGAVDGMHHGADTVTQVRGRVASRLRALPAEKKFPSGLEGPTTATDGCISCT